MNLNVSEIIQYELKDNLEFRIFMLEYTLEELGEIGTCRVLNMNISAYTFVDLERNFRLTI